MQIKALALAATILAGLAAPVSAQIKDHVFKVGIGPSSSHTVGPMRAALPMNLKGHFPGYKVWSRAQTDIERVKAIWRECLGEYGGPYLFGAKPGMADAMYAPVVTRLQTYDVAVDEPVLAAYCAAILALPEMQAWKASALQEPEAIDELEVEF